MNTTIESARASRSLQGARAPSRESGTASARGYDADCDGCAQRSYRRTLLPDSQHFLGMIATEVDQSFPFASVQTSTWYGTTSSRLALTRSVKDLCELLEQIERRGEP
jgi:hypothetical protein